MDNSIKQIVFIYNEFDNITMHDGLQKNMKFGNQERKKYIFDKELKKYLETKKNNGKIKEYTIIKEDLPSVETNIFTITLKIKDIIVNFIHENMWLGNFDDMEIKYGSSDTCKNFCYCNIDVTNKIIKKYL